MALVPAWQGERGRIGFDSGRVNGGRAADLHELIHVYAPNGNRFLAEGLAVYGHQHLGGHPAFPNFRRDLAEMVRGVATPELMQAIERVATPEPLERVHAQGEALAGGFVG